MWFVLVLFALLVGCQPVDSGLTTEAEKPIVPLNEQNQEIMPVATGSVNAASFTDDVEYAFVDENQNGLFNYLQVDVGLNVSEAGGVGVVANLFSADGQLVAIGSLTPDLARSVPALHAEVSPKTNLLSVYFMGADIRRNAHEPGSYTVQLSLTGESGQTLSTLETNIPSLTPQTFETGANVEVKSVTDSGLAKDGIEGYEGVRITAVIELLAPSELIWQGQLFAGDTFLTDSRTTLKLDAGVHTIHLDFPGTAVAANQLDGPYTAYLTLSQGVFIGDQTYTTAAYDAAEFQNE